MIPLVEARVKLTASPNAISFVCLFVCLLFIFPQSFVSIVRY
jgi:hypothetical protein